MLTPLQFAGQTRLHVLTWQAISGSSTLTSASIAGQAHQNGLTRGKACR